MKKILAIIVGGNQLLYAVQAKHTIHNIDEMDIVYRKVDIDENGAKVFFDNVYKCKSNEAPHKKDALRCFINPKYAISKYYADIDIDKYSDILFWHPDYLFYFLYKYSIYSHHSYNWHLLPEGSSMYTIDKYVIPDFKLYGIKPIRNLIRKIDVSIFGYPDKAEKLLTEGYFIQKKYAFSSGINNKIDIPPFDKDDVEYVDAINRMMKYKRMHIFNKIIILDGGYNGIREGFYDVEKMNILIKMIGNLVGKNNVLLKRKHNVGLEQYPEDVLESVTVYPNENMPWELMCLNDDLQDCIIISIISSAAWLPYIFCDCDLETAVIGSEYLHYYFSNNNALLSKQEQISKMLSDNNNKYRMINSEKDINDIIMRFCEYRTGSIDE